MPCSRPASDAAGGQDYLQAQAEKNPAAFLTLIGKVLPLQAGGEGGGPLVIQVVNYADTDPGPPERGPGDAAT